MTPASVAVKEVAGQVSSLAMAFGLPDDRMVRLTSVSSSGIPQLGIPGSLAVLPYLSPELRSRLQNVLVAPDGALSWPAGATAVVNCITDGDVCARALARLDDAITATGAACFNHPGAVLDSTRDGVANRLCSVEGLCVPRTFRLALTEPSDLMRALERENIRFPLIVRIAGSHGGTTTRKIDRPIEVPAALAALPWGGRTLYVTEYFDYRSVDGLYRKMRLVIVGKKVFLRHLVASGGWHVHADDREGDTPSEEEDALVHFPERLLPTLEDRVRQVSDALALDYFGIDCSMLDDGRLLVFEANPAMNILLNPAPSPNCWELPVQRIRDALERLILTPNEWRHRGAVAP